MRVDSYALLNQNRLEEIVNQADVSSAQINVGENPNSIDAYDNLYVANHGSQSISVIDPDRDKVIGNIQLGDYPSSMAIDPSSGHIYVAYLTLIPYR